MVRRSVMVLSVVFALSLAGCSSHQAAKTRVPNRPPGTVLLGSAETTLGPVDPATCQGGTVAVPILSDEPLTSTCVDVGAIVVVTAGYQGTGGSWPAPPKISGGGILHLLSSASKGGLFEARFKAVGTGTATVTATFVSSDSPCTPTPCTPIPGRPLVLVVTVVGGPEG
jgi:hypothetical protein